LEDGSSLQRRTPRGGEGIEAKRAGVPTQRWGRTAAKKGDCSLAAGAEVHKKSLTESRLDRGGSCSGDTRGGPPWARTERGIISRRGKREGSDVPRGGRGVAHGKGGVNCKKKGLFHPFEWIRLCGLQEHHQRKKERKGLKIKDGAASIRRKELLRGRNFSNPDRRLKGITRRQPRQEGGKGPHSRARRHSHDGRNSLRQEKKTRSTLSTGSLPLCPSGGLTSRKFRL